MWKHWLRSRQRPHFLLHQKPYDPLSQARYIYIYIIVNFYIQSGKTILNPINRNNIHYIHYSYSSLHWFMNFWIKYLRVLHKSPWKPAPHPFKHFSLVCKHGVRSRQLPQVSLHSTPYNPFLQAVKKNLRKKNYRENIQICWNLFKCIYWHRK